MMFHGKPLIQYAVNVLKKVSSHIIVVVGAYSESVQEVLSHEKEVTYAFQNQRLGTAHAVKVALESNKKEFDRVIVGYGDHMMFYHPETLKNLLKVTEKPDIGFSLVTASVSLPKGYGRIIRNETGHVIDIVEEKDATEEERNIQEINAGLYCFVYDFLVRSLPLIGKSPVTNEYYLTDVLKIAIAEEKRVVPLLVPYTQVGIGINTPQDYSASAQLYEQHTLGSHSGI